MFKFSTKIFLVIFVLTELAIQSGPCEAHRFMIDKSEKPEKTSVTVRLDRDYEYRVSSFYWANDVKRFFPQADSQKTFYTVAVNLEDFSGVSLNNITNFLVALANTPDVNKYTPVLHLESGTSYKFNKIFPGIKEFFQKTPRARVIYCHTGVQEPKSVRKGLNSLAPLKELREISSYTMKELFKMMKSLSIESKKELQKDSQVASFSEQSADDQEEGEGPIKTEEPVTFLQTAIQYEELGQEILKLQSKWTALGGDFWPPLGVENLDQVQSIGGIASLRDVLNDSSKPIVLEVAGLFAGDAWELLKLCRKKPSIRCVIVQDSACVPEDFKGFYTTGTALEEKAPGVLGEDKIRFLNVQTAFNTGEGQITDLYDYFARKHSKNSLDYFVQFDPYSLNFTDFQTLTPGAQKTHRLFWVLSAYLNLLRSDLSLLPDDHQ